MAITPRVVPKVKDYLIGKGTEYRVHTYLLCASMGALSYLYLVPGLQPAEARSDEILAEINSEL